MLGASIAAAPLFAQDENQSANQETVDKPVNPSDSSNPEGVRFDAVQTQHWRIGLILNTPVTCTNVLATFPIPQAWPEQTVTLIDKTIDPRVSRWQTRDLPGGAKQVVVNMARVTAGSNVEVLFTFQVERQRILPPKQTDQLVAPKRPSRELRIFMGDSPHIDASNGRVKSASREIAKNDFANDWEKVEHIYDFVRDNVDYVEGKLKNASQALKDGTGDCEEMTSLFVALCRNARIPARMVWIPGHCYPEFYLEDSQGKGHWYPCQAAGTRQFGRMDEYRPVLQKGDRFKVPEVRERMRYVSEFFRCDKKGKSDPRPKFVREMIEV